MDLLKLKRDVAENGVVACEKFRTQKEENTLYNIILMDLEMPVMNGYLATESIRSLESARGTLYSTPIIALTANAMADIRNKCIACGMNDVLAKPVLLTDLRKMIEKWATRS